MGQKTRNNPNIILIVIDALRTKNLGCYGGNNQASPHIDKIAQDGILFENAYSTWNTTDQSLTAILSGRYPRTHGVFHHGDKVISKDIYRFETIGIHLLSETLKQSGYKTLAVDWMARWFKKGFDHYGYHPQRDFWGKLGYSLVTLPYLYLKHIVPNIRILRLYSKKRDSSFSSLWKGLRDVFRTFLFTHELARIQDANQVTSLAEEWIKKTGNEKFFLFLHYWDTHSPYYCPKHFFKKKKGTLSSLDILLSRYQGAVSYVDHNIGKLLDFLEKEKRLKNTLIILTSDHGESLTEHGILFDHHGLYEATTHVPLIIYSPQLFSQPKRIKGLVQHIDLAPTLCELLNIKAKHYGFDGMSLMPLIKGKKNELRSYVFNEESYVQRKIGFRTKRFKYIFAPNGRGMCNYCQKVHGGVEELYDLANDPEEKINIAIKEKSMALKLQKEVSDLIKYLNSKREKEIIKGEILRLKEMLGVFKKGSFEMKKARTNDVAIKEKKVTLQLPEEIIEKISSIIQYSEFHSCEEYLSYLIQEIFRESSFGKMQSLKDEKKIRKKLQSLGYMD